jgi:hypothetical protein
MERLGISLGRSLVLAFFITLLVPGFSLAAKPQPVEELMGMFTTFNELETHIRSNQWDKAQAVLKEVEGDYGRVVEKLKPHVDDKLLHKFGFLMKTLEKRMAMKDPEKTEHPYMNLQAMFIDIMDNFDYPRPPVLLIISLYVDESKEYLERDEYYSISEEMEEIEHFRKRAIGSAKAAGMDTAKLKEFFELGERVQGLAGKKDRKAAGETLIMPGVFIPVHAGACFPDNPGGGVGSHLISIEAAPAERAMPGRGTET